MRGDVFVLGRGILGREFVLVGDLGDRIYNLHTTEFCFVKYILGLVHTMYSVVTHAKSRI